MAGIYKRILSILVTFIALLLLSINVWATNSEMDNSKQLKIYYIDVGHGDCILIQTPNEKTILVDSGAILSKKTVRYYLEDQGVSNIDILICTHPHPDHIGNMDWIIRNYDIGSIYMPKVKTASRTYKNMLKEIKAKKLKVNYPTAGENISVDDSIRIQVLAPNSKKYGELNNHSIVFKLTYKDNSFLFAGDALTASEKEMLKKGYNLKADVLKVSHHANYDATSSKFLEAVKPKYAVISLGISNLVFSKVNQTLNKLNKLKVKIYRTDKHGTILVTSDGKNIKFEKDR